MVLFRKGGNSLFYSHKKGDLLWRVLGCPHTDKDRVNLKIKGLPGLKITAHVCCNCGEVDRYADVETEEVRKDERI
jgi:hypothetical protein